MKPVKRVWRKNNNAARSFDAGYTDQFTEQQKTVSYSANVDIFNALRITRARARHSRDNSDYGKRFIQLCVNNIVGADGVHLNIQTDSPAVNKIILDSWKWWCRTCDVTGGTWIDILELAIKNCARDGEILSKFIISDGTLKLQPLDIDLLDIFRNDPQTNTIMGVQADQYGLPIAYHLLNKHPYDWFEPQKGNTSYDIIPADEILHCFERYRPMQRRGMPWGHTVYKRLHLVDGYEYAEVVGSRVAASNMGFFTRNDQGEGYAGTSNDDAETPEKAEPGTFYELPNGVSFQSFNPSHPNGNYASFMETTMHGIAAGFGISYMSLTGDLSKANYSSMKWGATAENENWIGLQNWFIRNFCMPVFAKWLEIELLSGRLKIPYTEYENIISNAVWRGRRWQGIDRLKDAQANQLEIQQRTTSISEIIRQQGRDPEAVWHELSTDMERLEALGLTPTELLGMLNSTPDSTAKTEEENGQDTSQ